MQDALSITNEEAALSLSLAAILLAGFLCTRVTKPLRLPNVTGYILAGILIGPFGLGLIGAGLPAKLDIITDLALGFIAFEAGGYFKLSTLRASGRQALVMTIFEALTAAVVVTGTMLLFGLPLPFSLLLGAIGSATAPASTIMTIRQYKARGNFVNLVLQVVAMDDAVALIAFSLCTAAIGMMEHQGFSAGALWMPLALNLAAVAVGLLLGWLLHKVAGSRHTPETRLLMAIAFLLMMTGVCAALELSPLLCCMAMGAAYSNTSESQKIFEYVGNFSPPILVMFFVLSGMRLNLNSLVDAGIIGVVYFAVRIAGKALGSWMGGRAIKAEPGVRRYFGMTLIPQAGVSIGLALLGQRMLPAAQGDLLTTIILSSSVLYEMVGPLCAKTGLRLAGTFPPEEAEKPAAIADAGRD